MGMILFHSCGGTRPAATLFSKWWCSGWDRSIVEGEIFHFEGMKKELDGRITMYHTKNPPHELILLLETDLHNVLIRLGSLKTTFDQMVFGVTEFQRCYLETLGLLDYLEIYRPRKYGSLLRRQPLQNALA
jgi:hypothetical protein